MSEIELLILALSWPPSPNSIFSPLTAQDNSLGIISDFFFLLSHAALSPSTNPLALCPQTNYFSPPPRLPSSPATISSCLNYFGSFLDVLPASSLLSPQPSLSTEQPEWFLSVYLFLWGTTFTWFRIQHATKKKGKSREVLYPFLHFSPQLSNDNHFHWYLFLFFSLILLGFFKANANIHKNISYLITHEVAYLIHRSISCFLSLINQQVLKLFP